MPDPAPAHPQGSDLFSRNRAGRNNRQRTVAAVAMTTAKAIGCCQSTESSLAQKDPPNNRRLENSISFFID